MLGVVGLGLIGGSMAKAWSGRGGATIGWSRSSATRDLARAQPGLVVVDTIGEVVAGADIVVLATPLSALADTLDAVAEALGHRTDLPTITDVGSVKAPITDHARRVLPDPSIFVPGHPMAGTEHAGWRQRRPEPVRAPEVGPRRRRAGRPGPLGRRRAGRDLRWDALVVPVEVADHDRATALISHLPYAIAAGLKTLLRQEENVLASTLAAGSFRSATRVVSGDGRALGGELTTANRANVVARLDEMQQWLAGLRAALADGDRRAVEEAFHLHGAVPAGPPDGRLRA